MNRLPSIIGLAPSELTFESFCAKLTIERNRIRFSLDEFRKRRALPKTKGAAKGKAKSPLSLAKQLGLSPEQLLKGLEILEAQAKLTASKT